MARKTFISYKHSDAEELRDKIIVAMKEWATYYQGEHKNSPDRSENTDGTIEKALKDMMYNTSVTIVIISPNMKESNWIDWEIEYCLKEITRKDRTSKTNGVVGVVMKVNGSYDWFIKTNPNTCHGSETETYKVDKTFEIIAKNIYNSKIPQIICDKCNTYDSNYGSYISFVKEEYFLKNANKYIDIAYEKSERVGDYNIYKQ